MNFIRPKFCRGLAETSTVFSRPLAGLTNGVSVRLVTTGALVLSSPKAVLWNEIFQFSTFDVGFRCEIAFIYSKWDFFCMACRQCYIWYVKRVRDAVSHGAYDTFLIIECSSSSRTVCCIAFVCAQWLCLALGVNSPLCCRYTSKVYS